MVAIGCTPADDATTVHSCSPSYVDANESGRISAQQKGPGQSVQWGVYPRAHFVRLVVRVYAGGRKVDGKDQDYYAHGTVSAAKVRKAGRGSILRIEGATYDGDGKISRFFLRCRLA
jgi:hypothetical protein